MRSPQDLIKDLEGVAAGSGLAAIVVAFDESTVLVWGRGTEDGDPFTELQDLIRAGGRPVGIARILRFSSSRMLFHAWPFAELRFDGRVMEYFGNLATCVMEVLRRHGLGCFRHRPELN